MRFMRLFVSVSIILLAAPAFASSRIKDIVNVEGVRENVLVGYGLVVGLNGTGDTINSMAFTQQSIIAMLERFGTNTSGGSIKPENVAAVMVTASLPPFARQGGKIDVTVSAMGDADSLSGGTLIVTPLLGADGEVYAIAQGPVAIGGFEAKGATASVTKGVPTTGRIAGGAIVEREVAFELDDMSRLKLALKNPDLTTANRITAAINSYVGTVAARTRDPGTVELAVPSAYKGKIVTLLSDIEKLRVEPDLPAKVVIDEKSGVVVVGENVRISKVAIAQGNLTIRITETPLVSQPAPFAEVGRTVVVPETKIDVDEQANNRMHELDTGVSLQELVEGLNSLGIGPRDIISILQAVKAAGALQAEIEVI